MLEGGREKEEKWNRKTGRAYMCVNREEIRRKVREDKQMEGRGAVK